MISNRSTDNNISSNSRLSILFVLFLVFIIILIVKLAYWQIWQHDKYLQLVDKKFKNSEVITAKRGDIYLQDYKDDSKLSSLATNRQYYLLYANTTEIKRPEKILEQITPLLKIEDPVEKEAIDRRLKKENDIYEPLKRRLTEEDKKKVEELKLPGLYFQAENLRYYPEKNIGSHLIGFVGYTDSGYQGIYGLEEYFQNELRGKDGNRTFNSDPRGSLIATSDRTWQPAEDGASIVLTIDRSLEYFACSMLEKYTIKVGASRGSVIILDPNSGAVMAMCDYPDFDPNEYNKVTGPDVYNNPAVSEAYEPGSVFKALTMAMALDQNLVTPDTEFTDTGEVEIAGFKIHNAMDRKYGKVTMTGILENSINTGAIWVARKVGIDKFRTYLQNLGFGKQTGIELGKEAAGNISSLKKKGDIYLATASFGQGLTATPLQLVSAFVPLANGGKLYQPYLVDHLVWPNGTIEKKQPVMKQQVISPKTSMLVSAMLASVVKNGHAKGAQISGYYVAGKTGTAQVTNQQTGGYDTDKTIHTFVGFAPVTNPRFVMITKFDHPTNVQWADSSTAPLFAEIAQFLLNYLQVPAEIHE